jgi:hypothetical protein
MLKKALLGAKVRRLRQDRNLTQQQMAARLGISGAYLNLIEHDQRPVTVALLLKLGQAFDLDLQSLSDDSERRLAAQVSEALSEPSLGAAAVEADQISRLVATAPDLAQAVVALHRAYRTARGGSRSRPRRRAISSSRAPTTSRRSRRRPRPCAGTRRSTPPTRSAGSWLISSAATGYRSTSCLATR